MNIDNIRDQLAMQMPIKPEWLGVLNNTNPGHYGIVESDIVISRGNIWVDVPGRTFLIENVKFDFVLKLGTSSEDDGFQANFTKIACGKGRFYFDEECEKIVIEELQLDVDLDLF